MIKGTADFFSVQYYTSCLVKYQENDKGELGVLQDMEIEIFPDPSWISLAWFCVVPWGLRKLLKYIKVHAHLSVSVCAHPNMWRWKDTHMYVCVRTWKKKKE